MTDKQLSLLIKTARETRENAWALKSEHKIGAAVLTSKGNVYGGCNIEANISGLGICAERCAINNAIAHGEYAFTALATFDNKPVVPCGACLQYLLEFRPLVEDEIFIVTASPDDAFHLLLNDLLPKGYISPKSKEKAQSYDKGRN